MTKDIDTNPDVRGAGDAGQPCIALGNGYPRGRSRSGGSIPATPIPPILLVGRYVRRSRCAGSNGRAACSCPIAMFNVGVAFDFAAPAYRSVSQWHSGTN
jgi:hypothetical protein